MLNVDKSRNRKSRAPWQNSKNKNPYANDNVNTNSNDNFLAAPNPYTTKSTTTERNINNDTKKQNRRLSIHASAHQRQHGRSFSSVSEMPAVPSLPTPIATQSSSSTSNPDLANKLSQGSAAEIDDFYKLLTKQRNEIVKHIKENINLNQQNILQLTQDLKLVQDELMALRKSTREVLEVTSFFKQAAEKKLELEFQPQKQEESKRRDRSSILILENMWKKELQSLYKHVDGASKFIQPIPGRHVIAESGRWIEVNAGTWKHGNAAHLFVLNDLLLIASKAGDKRLHATQCFPLNQVSLRQITPPTEDKSNYINIKYQNLSYIFSSDRYDHFMKIMEAFKKGKQEMEQANRLKQNPKSNEVRNSRKSKRNSEELLNSITTKVDFKDNFDEIEVYINYNEYQKALELISHVSQKLSKKPVLNENDQLLVQVTKNKLENKKEEILAGLEFQLKNQCSHIKLPTIISLYHKLNRLEDGITIYLKSCSIDYRDSLVAVLNLKKRVTSLIPIIREFSDSTNSSLVIRWCTDEAKKIADHINCDTKVLAPYLKEFKQLGINLDFLFLK